MDKATAYKSNPLLRAFEQSEGSAEELLDITRTTLSGIYYGLGERNFYRWLNKQRVSEGLKNLVVQVMTEEDIKKHPSAAGFYTTGTDIQKLRPGYLNEKTNRHELLHFLTDFLKSLKTQSNRYGTFLNEGLTEYLTLTIEKIVNPDKLSYTYVYEPNVEFVDLLHTIMGDGLIKSYLSGRTEKSDKDMSTYLTEDGSENLKELEKFQDLLGDVHNILYANINYKENPSKTARDMYEIQVQDMRAYLLPQIRVYVSNIMANYVREFAKNLEYIEDGKVDIDAICGDVRGVRISLINLVKNPNNILGLDPNSEECSKYIEDVMNRAVQVAFEEMGIEVSDEAKFTVRNPKNPRESVMDIPEVRRQGNVSEQELFLSMIQRRREKNHVYMNDGTFDMARFVMDVSILVDKFGCDEKQIDMAISTTLPEGIDKKFVSQIIAKYSTLYSSISYLDGADKNETNETKLYQIENDIFLVNRDGKYSTIRIDPENGTVAEVVGIGFIERDRKAEKVLDPQKEKGICAYKLAKNSTYSRNHQVIIRDSEDEVRIDGSKAVAIEGFERFAETLIIQEALAGITKNPKKYAFNLHDDTTPNYPEGVLTIANGSMIRNDSYILNFRGLKQDLDRVGGYLPDSQKRVMVEQALGKILKNVYGAKLEDFPEILTLMDNPVLLEEKPNETFIKKLMNLTDKLNEHKRTLRKATTIQGFIVPQNIPDRDKKVKELEDYFRKMEDYKGRKELKKQTSAMIKEQVDFKNSFTEKYFEQCIIEAIEPQQSIANYLVMRGVRVPGHQAATLVGAKYDLGNARKVDYKSFCDALKAELTNVLSSQRKKVLNSLVTSAVMHWYGYTEEVDLNGDTTEFSEFIRDAVAGYVFDDKELDIDGISQREADYVGKLDVSKKKSDDLMTELVDQLEPTFQEPGVEAVYYSMMDIIHDESMPRAEKEKFLNVLAKRNDQTVTKNREQKRKMEAFGKLALSGENAPSQRDVIEAENVLSYRGKENEGGER